MSFDQTSVTNPAKYIKDMQHLEDIGQAVKGSALRPGYSTAIHEMGHVLDNYSFETVTYRMEEALPTRFLEWTGRDPKDIVPDPLSWPDDLYREWGKFLTDNMSTYSFDPSWADPKLNPPEALAEAFADVWLNGKAATDTSKEIVSALNMSMESARQYDLRNKNA